MLDGSRAPLACRHHPIPHSEGPCHGHASHHRNPARQGGRRQRPERHAQVRLRRRRRGRTSTAGRVPNTVDNTDRDADCTIAITLENLAALVTRRARADHRLHDGQVQGLGRHERGAEAAARGLSRAAGQRRAGGARHRAQEVVASHRDDDSGELFGITELCARVRHHAAHDPLLRGQGPAGAAAHQRHPRLHAARPRAAGADPAQQGHRCLARRDQALPRPLRRRTAKAACSR